MSAADGVRVLETGLIVVHEGEVIRPAEGAEARLAPTGDADVHLHFPVHVSVVAGLPEAARVALREDLLDELYQALS